MTKAEFLLTIALISTAHPVLAADPQRCSLAASVYRLATDIRNTNGSPQTARARAQPYAAVLGDAKVSRIVRRVYTDEHLAYATGRGIEVAYLRVCLADGGYSY